MDDWPPGFDRGDGATIELRWREGDLVMPGEMSGWQLAESAWQLRPGLPVLFTSGYAQESVVRYSRIDSRTPFINKPYRKAQLATQVRALLDETGKQMTDGDGGT
jgi:FixJ family two-component response regulator